MKELFDVVILGGGLAGLTLSLQLKKQRPNTSILVLEKRAASAPEAAHKVGESTVELGTHYLREVLDLKDYLDAEQLPKHGLRFFFSPQHKDEIHKRVELGPKQWLPIPSHQLDRGILENDLIKFSREAGAEILLDAKVVNVEMGEEEHVVEYEFEGEAKTAKAKWVIDATGRNAFLKRKMGFAEHVDHDVSSAWFRIDHKVDIDDWSDDEHWHSHVEKGLRHLSTVHLMDNGYWVWIIPLVGGRTSIGIVADPALHPFSDFNDLNKALAWIDEHEPQLSKELAPYKDKIIDFKVMKHFAHGSGEVFSTDRWAVTGESGLFLDPFYSPGTDMIAMSNTFAADLIQRDLDGEDVFLRTKYYTEVYRALFEYWLPLYKDQYGHWGKTQVMVAKIYWDWAGYWAMNTLLFVNEGLTDMVLLRKISAGPTTILKRYGELSDRMQKFFMDWAQYDTTEFSVQYFDPFDISYLREFQEDILESRYNTEEMHTKLVENIEVLEHIASELFRLVSTQVFGTPFNMKVDPYTMSLDPKKTHKSINSVQLERGSSIADELSKIWLYEKVAHE